MNLWLIETTAKNCWKIFLSRIPADNKQLQKHFSTFIAKYNAIKKA